MSKRIKLTWTNNIERIVEECDLVSDDDPIYTFDGFKPDLDITNKIAKFGYVLFEDENGLFCLPPDQIIEIEVV